MSAVNSTSGCTKKEYWLRRVTHTLFEFLKKIITKNFIFCAVFVSRNKQELLLHLSFKAELPTNGRQDFFLGFKIYPDVKKLLQGHWAILSYLGLQFPQFLPQKGNFRLYLYCKVIGYTNHELRISNYQLKVYRFFW